MNNYLLIPCALACYALLAWWVHGYSQGWLLPEALSDRALMLRNRIGYAVGGLGAGIAAMVCAFAPFELDSLRWIIAFQAVLMAAAGASDLRRFLLPLPITVFGVVLAAATLINTQPSGLVMGIALAWAILCIGINALASKGTVQLGDHLAVLWIALAAPFNGLLAFTLGTLANALTVLVFRWQRRRMAVAGAWLISAAVLIGLPPFYSWGTPMRRPVSKTPVLAHPARPAPVTTAPAYRAESRAIASEARDLVARVSFADSSQMRQALAGQAATYVARLIARTNDLDLVSTLQSLERALRDFDVIALRALAESLARYI